MEKMLVTSIFPFSHSVLKRHLFSLKGRYKSGLCDKGLNIFFFLSLHFSTVKLYSNLMTGEIQVSQTGSNSSVLDGIEMIKDKVYGMRHSSTLHILAGLYPQKLHVKHLRDPDKTESRMSNHNHSFNDADQTKEKERKTSKSEQKSGTKRKSYADDTDNAVSKKPKISEKELDSNKKHTPKAKDKDTETSRKDSKQTKIGSVNTSKYESKKDRKASQEIEEKYLQDVNAKLNTLKAAVKDIKIPTKERTPSSKNKLDKMSDSKDNGEPGHSHKAPATCTSSRWDQYDSLYVYTSKGLEGRSRVCSFHLLMNSHYLLRKVGKHPLKYMYCS